MVERPELIFRDLEAWEEDFLAMQFEHEQACARRYPPELLNLFTASQTVLEGAPDGGATAPAAAPGGKAGGKKGAGAGAGASPAGSAASRFLSGEASASGALMTQGGEVICSSAAGVTCAKIAVTRPPSARFE